MLEQRSALSPSMARTCIFAFSHHLLPVRLARSSSTDRLRLKVVQVALGLVRGLHRLAVPTSNGMGRRMSPCLLYHGASISISKASPLLRTNSMVRTFIAVSRSCRQQMAKRLLNCVLRMYFYSVTCQHIWTGGTALVRRVSSMVIIWISFVG